MLYKAAVRQVHYYMITAKIGGTSVTASNLAHLHDIITPQHNCIVVSAIGKEFADDVKTTDLLQQYYYTQSPHTWRQICDKYRRLVQVNAIDIDIDKLLYNARCRAVLYDVNYCMSLGEELSAQTVAAYLSAQYIEAENAVFFYDGKPMYRRTYTRIRRLFDQCKLGVTGGFYGYDVHSGRRCTFPRGGGDISGALFARALNSTLYENWTDVYGVCVANPAKVASAVTVPHLSYAQMLLLANSGAEVLHPDAIYPVRAKAIPIRIGNFTNPNGASTLICNCPCTNKLLSVAERSQTHGVITTILHTCSTERLMRVVSDFFAQCRCGAADMPQVLLLNAFYGCGVARMHTDKSVLNALYKYLAANL